MASVHRTDGGWRAMWRVWTGEAHGQRSRTFAARREAEAFARQMERTLEARGVVAQDEPTLAEFGDRFLAWAEAQLLGSTVAGYRRSIAYLLPRLGAVPLRRLTTEMLDAAYTALRKSGGVGGRALHPRTVLHVHRVAHRMLGQAVKWRLLEINPAANATAPRVPPVRAVAPSIEQVARLIAAADREPWPQLLILAVSTGARRGELLGLAWRDVDLDAGWIDIGQVCEQVGNIWRLRDLPKTKTSRRRIAIAPDVCVMLRAWRTRLQEQALRLGLKWRPGAALVFPDFASGDVGAPYEPNAISGHASYLWRRAGLPAGIQPLHGLRHRHASALMDLPLKLVSDRLGHSTIRVTADLYQHGDEAAARRAGDAAGAAFGSLVRLADRQPKPG
jgi:integrase